MPKGIYFHKKGVKRSRRWKLSQETRGRMSLARRGDKHPGWKGGFDKKSYSRIYRKK